MGTLAFQGVWGGNRDRVADLMRIVLGSSPRLFAVVIRHRFCPNLRQVKARKRTGSGERPIRARNKHLCVLEAGTVTALNLGDGVSLRSGVPTTQVRRWFCRAGVTRGAGENERKTVVGLLLLWRCEVPFTMTVFKTSTVVR